MRVRVRAVLRNLIFLPAIAVATIEPARSDETRRRVTIGAPLVGGEMQRPLDPFTANGPIPTPFVPYASQSTELEIATPPSAVIAPTPPAMTTAPARIEAGDLVPISMPTMPAEPAGKTAVGSTVNSAPAAVRSTSAEPMTPIRPAVLTHTPTSTAAKEKAEKKAAIETHPVSAPSQASPADSAPQPMKFSFPQPIIPLESALRRRFGFAPSRG